MIGLLQRVTEARDRAIRRGVVRHCPTCDAYEVRDRAIAILGAQAIAWGRK